MVLIVCLCACGKGERKAVYGKNGTLVAFDLDADTAAPGYFWELPYPSDLRLTAGGRPQLAAFPNPRGLPMVETFRAMAMERAGFPVVPVGYFRFSAPLARSTSRERSRA